MAWNAATYNKFKTIRFQPFYDLVSLIQPEARLKKAVDLGCGTGEQTAILGGKFTEATFIGVDSSTEMLSQSDAFKRPNVSFQRDTITHFLASADASWDLIFSNAALQWLDDHEKLFPKLIACLTSGGQLAVQMPYQPENKLNRLLSDLAEEQPFKQYLDGWNRISSVLTLDDYAELLFRNGLQDLHISQKIYPIIAETHDDLYDFIAGSALIPYLERLTAEQKIEFTAAFRLKITAAFPNLPAFYSFKRIFLYGKKCLL